jgi:S-methylmethionine-dependent homocysteine/selenocysteine methylase
LIIADVSSDTPFRMLCLNESDYYIIDRFPFWHIVALRLIMRIQEIAQEVHSTLSAEEKQYITSISEPNLINLYYGPGTAIQNQYLWHKQKLEDAVSPHMDVISCEIIRAIWEIAKSENN